MNSQTKERAVTSGSSEQFKIAAFWESGPLTERREKTPAWKTVVMVSAVICDCEQFTVNICGAYFDYNKF